MLFSPPHSLEPMGNRHRIKLPRKSDDGLPDTPSSVPPKKSFALAATGSCWLLSKPKQLGPNP